LWISNVDGTGPREYNEGSKLQVISKSDWHVSQVIDQAWGQYGWVLAKFFFCVFIDRDRVEDHKLAKKRTRPIQRVIPNGQYSAILPARIANHSTRFGSSSWYYRINNESIRILKQLFRFSNCRERMKEHVIDRRKVSLDTRSRTLKVKFEIQCIELALCYCYKINAMSFSVKYVSKQIDVMLKVARTKDLGTGHCAKFWSKWLKKRTCLFSFLATLLITFIFNRVNSANEIWVYFFTRDIFVGAHEQLAQLEGFCASTVFHGRDERN